jgi:UDP-2,3-diacylglucosamine hydrolase
VASQQAQASGRAAALGGLPVFWEIVAPAGWRSVDFVSDLHLCAERPLTFDAFAAYLQGTTADAVFILGDLFELWIGDDARDAPFEARCCDLLAEASATRSVAFMAGNRDFLVGADMLRSCGVMALADPAVLIGFGQRLLLSHGDALCVSDLAYQRFRAEVRSPRWQREFLALPLPDRLSRARGIREESERRKRAIDHGDWADVDAASAVRWMHEAGARTLIHGHTHSPGSEPLAPGFIRHVLTDWELDEPGAPPRAEVLRLSARGLRRMAPIACTQATA